MIIIIDFEQKIFKSWVQESQKICAVYITRNCTKHAFHYHPSTSIDRASTVFCKFCQHEVAAV